jgi:hypothetical protein
MYQSTSTDLKKKKKKKYTNKKLKKKKKGHQVKENFSALMGGPNKIMIGLPSLSLSPRFSSSFLSSALYPQPQRRKLGESGPKFPFRPLGFFFVG